MRIGLDWDGTVNTDTVMFREIVVCFLNAGHDVAVVTWRSAPDTGDIWPDMAEVFEEWGFKIPVYHCHGEAKRTIYDADIWIDDNPASVMFKLNAKPRFEANPSDYDADILTLDAPDNPVSVTWADLKPRSFKAVSPVNFEE